MPYTGLSDQPTRGVNLSTALRPRRISRPAPDAPNRLTTPLGYRARRRSETAPPPASSSPLSPPSSPLPPPRKAQPTAAGPATGPPPPQSPDRSDPSSTPSAERPQARTPLVDAVRQRGNAVHEAPFHVPGHKRGTGAPPGLVSLVRPSDNGSVLQYDLTEIAGLDFLSSPSGVILEAQRLAAEEFGADRTWFLVNGCSVGIHAAVMAVTAAAADGCGDQSAPTLLVARNCHLSAFSAMVLAGCQPYWVQPEVDDVFGVAHCVTHGSVQAALRGAAAQGRRVAGVLIVSPTYFGAVADVAAIAAECHEHGVPLLVDEAHGGHFAFLPQLPPPPAAAAAAAAAGDRQSRLQPEPQQPPSALSCGADIVIQSTHKVLGALTQAAMLHAAGPRVCPSRLGRALQTLQSSSPSYLLMASLDAARAQAAAGGAFDEPYAAAQAIRDVVSRCQRVHLLDESTAGSRASVRWFDPLRLTLLVDELRLPGGGFQAAEWLERQHGVVPELATVKTVVLALGPGTTMGHAFAASKAITELDQLPDQLLDRVTGPIASDRTDFHEQADVVHRAAAAASDSAAPAPPPPLRWHIFAGSPAAAEAEDGEGHTQAAPTAAEEPEVVLTPRAAYFAATESVAASDAQGRVSAELLCPYPPGVPVLFPGERITAAALDSLRATLAAGGVVTGALDGSLATLQVVSPAS